MNGITFFIIIIIGMLANGLVFAIASTISLVIFSNKKEQIAHGKTLVTISTVVLVCSILLMLVPIGFLLFILFTNLAG